MAASSMSGPPWADQLLDEGDMVGAETWHRILNAIIYLAQDARRRGEHSSRAPDLLGWVCGSTSAPDSTT
jgi:hypothetical protein